jgi:hypothetical protein
MVKAYQEFYRDGGQLLIDGMFTEAEVKLLMTPTTLRPAQYRPDLPLMVEEWKRNFWDANYDSKSAAIPRAAHRVLAGGVPERVGGFCRRQDRRYGGGIGRG